MGRRLEALHERSGTKLLTKTPTGYVMTSAGESVLPHAELMEAEALAIERAILGGDLRLAGIVRVTTVEALGAHILAPAFPAFIKTYPNITIALDTDTRMVSLSRREADIALRVARFDQHETVMRKVGVMSYGLYASRAYLEEKGEPDFSKCARGHNVIALQEDLLHMPEAQWLMKTASGAHIAFRTNSRNAQAHAAVAGLGLACLPRFVGDKQSLVRLTPPVPPPPRELFIGVHRDTQHTPRIRTTIDFIVATLNNQAPVLNPGG
jgi:DNA-binding transcriptional LysR family regulator